jgi:hypothetical protein
MGLKVVFENVAILYTPYIHNPIKSKTFTQKTPNKKHNVFQGVEP